jgi:hypothetical protein
MLVPNRSAAHPSSDRWLALCLLLGVAACTSAAPERYGPVDQARYRSESSSESTRPLRSGAAPTWRYQPLSWNKLESIEAWLAGDGRFASAADRVDAELVLAEGRLTFARRDAQRVSASVLSSRLEAAEQGFQNVAHSRDASPDARRRAQNALREISGLRPAAPKSMQVVPRAKWAATPAIPARLTASSGSWSRITVHHSAEYAGLLRQGGIVESARAIQGIQRYHVETKGYGDIAYHFLVDPTGNVFEGRSLSWQGAHAGGTNNVKNIGICLLGDFDREAPTATSLAALERLVAGLRTRYGIASSGVYGHGELRTTECPGRHLRTWLASFRNRSGSAIASR